MFKILSRSRERAVNVLFLTNNLGNRGDVALIVAARETLVGDSLLGVIFYDLLTKLVGVSPAAQIWK